MKWTKQRLNNLFFVIGIVAVVVMCLTFEVSFAELWQHLSRAGYWLVPILGIWFLVYALNAWAWQSIIRCNTDEHDGHVGFWRIYRLTISGYALNYATPVGGLGGEPYRIMELSKDVSNQHATSSVILYAMMHFFAHFWLWFTSIFLYLALALIDYVPMTPALGVMMGAAIVFCLLAFYVFSKGYKNGIVVKILKWIGHIPGLKGWSNRFLERHAEALSNIDAQIASLHKQDRRTFYASLLLEYGSRIVQSLEILFMLLLFGIDCGGGFQGLFFTFLYSVLILSFTTLMANLIGFLPMQLGVQEGGFMLSIALIGMSTKLGSHVDSAALGIFVSIICRVREILWIFFGIALMKVDTFHWRKAAVLLALVVPVCTSCSDDDDDPYPWQSEIAERTVLVYMAAENNLTVRNGYRYLQRDFNEMVEGSRQLKNNQRLLVFVDSLNQGGSNGTPFIVELHGGKVYPVKEYSEEFYSSDPVRFREVLQTMMRYAEAENYGLVLWGHGSGWAVTRDTIASDVSSVTGSAAVVKRRAYGQDQGRDGGLGSDKWMNITQMAAALSDLPRFDFIMADCCNMLGVEVAYELRHATRYLIGSPAEIPGNGAPYHLLMSALYKQDAALYQGVIDTYYDYYADAFLSDSELRGYSLPLAVVDTRYIEELAETTCELLPRIVPHYPSQLPLSSTNVVFYWYYDVPVMYDVRAAVRHFASDEDYRAWDVAYQMAVPYHRMSMRWMTEYYGIEHAFPYFNHDAAANGCISMYVPSTESGYTNGTYQFNRTFKRLAWHQQMDWARMGW